ncbi:hypothetical protein ACQPZF_09185 [Actinosynnema sp. CS-041913]|uniref:hypothetical protein n=1 Tax=Actinosynnema sp. CS-041913 TaxID=3239917 RepID=UPI003D918E3A
MSLTAPSAQVGAWVVIESGTDIKFVANELEESIELTFAGDPAFELVLSRESVRQCLELFPQALAELEMARQKPVD